MRRPLALAAVLAALLPGAPAAAQSPSPSACPELRVEAGDTTVRVNEPVALVGTSSDPAGGYRLEVTAPYQAPVRSGSGARTEWTVRPSDNTTLRLRSTTRGQYICVSAPLRLLVEPSVTISATRVGTREYVFRGRVLPGRQQLATLYRVTPSGPVITAQRRVDDDGTYFLGRSFASPGRFDFFVGVGSSKTTEPGRSATRNTLVY